MPNNLPEKTAAPAQALHPLFASILAAHLQLPRGPYPTARWPEGLTQKETKP